MFVSQFRERQADPARQAAMAWLQRQMAWEQVLRRLRHEAGVAADRSAEVAAAA